MRRRFCHVWLLFKSVWRVSLFYILLKVSSSATCFHERYSVGLNEGKKVKQSLYRPGQALRVPQIWGAHISRQPAYEGGKVVSPTHRPPLPPRKYSLLISVRGWVDPRAIVQPEGLCQWNNSNDTIGNRTSDHPACRAVPQPTVHSWLKHYATSLKVASSIPDCAIGIFHWHNLSGCTMAIGSIQTLTEMSTSNISWE